MIVVVLVLSIANIGMAWGAETSMPTSGSHSTNTKYAFSNSAVTGGNFYLAQRSSISKSSNYGWRPYNTGIALQVSSPVSLTFTIKSNTTSSRTITGQAYAVTDPFFNIYKNTTAGSQTLENYVIAVNAKSAGSRSSEEAAIAAVSAFAAITSSADANKQLLICEDPGAFSEAVAYGSSISHSCPTTKGATNTFTVNLSAAGKYVIYLTSSGSSVGITKINIVPRKTIYMVPGNWNNDTPKFYVHSWGDFNDDVLMTVANCETNVFRADVPTNNTNLLFTRQNPSSTEIKYKDQDGNWNQSANYSIGSNNQFTFSGTWSDGEGKSTFNAGTYSAPTFTVTYDANGGTGSVPVDGSSPYSCGSNVTILGNTGSLAKAGKAFDGWNTASGGGGTSYTEGSILSNITGDVTLFAKWVTAYSVTYNANGGSGSVPSDATPYVNGATVTVLGRNTLTKSDYVFAGWNTKSDGSGTWYIPTETFSMGTKNVTLYAQWATCISTTDFAALSDAMGTRNLANTQSSLTSNNIKHSLGGDTRYDNSSGYHGLKLKHTGDWIGFGVAAGNTVTIKTETVGASPEVTIDFESAATLPANTDKAYEESGSARYFRIKSTDGSKAVVINKITIGTASCTAPTGLTAGSVTAKGATFTVTDGANTNDYEIVCKTTSGTPAADATPTYTSTSKTKAVTDLVAGTKYYAWVRSKCSASNKSAWVSGGNFTTSTVTVTHTLTNVTETSGAATSGVGGSDYTAVYAADAEYSMPTPTVTIDGNTATSGTDYTWSSGTLTIPANKINGNIVITLNSVPSAPSSAVISGTYHYFPGENISLTCTPSGNNGPTTYQWYKGGKENGNAIAGATSATYTKNSCAFADAGSYYCKVTCNATSIWANTNSSENYDVKILRLYVNGSKSGDPYGNVDFVKVDGTTATASIALGSGWTYGFNIADGCGHYYGNAGTMTENNCGPWVTNVNGTDCGLTTTNAATYIFTINYSNLSMITTSVTYPAANQAAGKVIYFDNNVLKWTGSSIYYRIGHSSHSQADQLSLVPGTANLYKMTTREYNGFSAWQIGNAEGGNGSDKSIYNTKNSPAITASIAYEGGAVTAAAVTVTPGADHSRGGDAQNNNCEFYSKTITNGMKKDRVTISQPSNGTITVSYTREDGVHSSLIAAAADQNADLAHTVILTSITTSPNEGYDAGAITINGSAYSGANYVVTGATTIAASFTPQTYSITYKDQGGAAFSGSHADGYPTTHTYGTATTLKTASKTGYTFGGWYGNPECAGAPMTSISGTSYTGNFTLYAKWTANQYTVTHTLDGVTKSSGATGANAATYGTNYTAVFAAAGGFALPSTIDVTIGGDDATSGTEYTWDQASGTVTINGSYILGDIVITVSAAGGCPTGGDIFTLVMDYSSSSATKVPANSTLAWSDSYGDVDGGTVTLGNKNASSTDHMQVVKTNILKFGGNDGYVKIDLDCPLKTGDIISFTSEETNQISFTKTDTRATSPATSKKKWTVTAAYNNVSTIYLWRASGSTVNLHTINITRPVTVTFDKNGGSSVSPTSTTYDGTAEITLPEPVRADYRCTGWNTAIGGDGTDLGLPGETYRPNVTTNTQTIYAQWVEKSCASGTIYKFLTKTDLANGDLSTKNELFYVKTSNYLANLTGGRLQAFANGSNLTISDGKNFKFNDNSSYLLLTLDCPLRATDHMKWKVSSQDLVITKTSTRATTITLTKGDGDVAVPEGLVGATQLWIWKGSSGGKISYFEIIRSASTYNVTYDGNDQTSAAGTVPADATNYAYNATVTTAAQGSLAKTNYTFGGWNTANDGTGTNTAAGSTFSITDNTTLYAKWTQAVTLDANTANHGSTDGSATAVWNATGLTGITHATPASGYKLAGYYTAKTDGTKVLNADGTYAGTAVTGWISDSKWTQNATSTPTLYAQYESAGSLIWNLSVNTDATSLTTSSKSSSFTEISTSNMSNAALKNLTYSGDKKSNLTGIISTPSSYTSSDYVYVTFQVASGYKFTPSSVKVKAQPVTSAKSVKLVLEDEKSHSINFTTASTISGGSTQTVEMTNGSSVYFEGTVTLKIYCYGAADAYRLGTPITIDGEVEETCGTMPSYTSMSYTTTTFAPGYDASGSPITIVGGENIDTYQWKYNKVNDRTSGTNCGTNNASLTPLTDESATTDGTRYYWCEMTNEACDITIKSPAVAITVAAAKSDASVTWTDPATPNYGGGGYTIKATVDQSAWNGNAADLVITAPAGIRIYNVSSGTDVSSRKYVQADFDVQTSFDRSTYASNIPFTVSAAATASYNAISDDHNVSYSACTGGAASEELMPVNVDSVNSTVKGWRFIGKGKMWFGHGSGTPSTGSNNIKSLDNTMAGGVINKYYNNSGSYFSFYTEKAITGVRLYVYTSNNGVKVSNVYIANSQFATGTPSSGAVSYDVVYNDDNDGLDKGDNVYSAWAEITFASEVAAGKYGLIKLDNNVKIAGIGLLSNSGSGASLNTHLRWSGGLADGGTVSKSTNDAYFTYSASMITENTNSLGAITYSSSVPSVATVDATGKVAMVAAGTTTIKATLAASGCYKKAEISYKLNVSEPVCSIAAGTLELTSGSETKCEGNEVTLTLTGFESGATTLQWKDGDTDINHNGSTYKIATAGTTSTLTTNQPGTYSVIVTNGCVVRSNRITITNKSTSVHVTRLVKEWYIKNGRLTPDIALWELGDDCSFVGVTASSGWDAGTDLTEAKLGEKVFYEKDGIVYMKGTEPKANAGAVQNYTLTLTVNDGCGNQTLTEEGKKITIHHQQNTDKHVLAFVVTGTEKGGFTEGITAAQTTSVELYNTIAANFDVLATNVYSTDDEQALKEYYSQFDILCVTDYPNTGTKGVNKKSYVDALGALVDIRPILTMEAFVAKLANWKAKGISGTPQSPTTRQYSMLLQCKDHEIFAGTELTKVGEGEDEMYRVSMVDNTLEDYVTLDATYGGGEHAEKSGYEYGSKPALQGFTFNATMAADGLLPLGLIDDGAGNDLQVGIERQADMEARLMVLGINGYAMERLTDDGQTVVVNALKYLMKKNSEDIADCSNTFVGGAEGEETNWNNAANWSGNTVPDKTQKVRIVAPCVIMNGTKARVAGVIIAPNGKYNHDSDNATGSLTISAGAALIVDGKVEAATAPYFTKTRATSAGDLAVLANSDGNGTLIFDNGEGETKATIQMHSKAVSDADNDYENLTWQYVAVPFSDNNNAHHNYYDSWLYAWAADNSGWEAIPNRGNVYPWIGYCITQDAPKTYTMDGTLVETTEQEFTVPAGVPAAPVEKVIGNSWTAPLQVKQFTDEDFGSLTKNIYLFNTGYDPNGEGNFDKADGRYEGGTYVTIPIHSSTYTGDSLVSSLQAFFVKNESGSEATLTLDYDRHVRPTRSTDKVNAGPMHAPSRFIASDEPTVLKIWASGSRYDDRLILLEREDFSTGYDAGWDGDKWKEGDASPRIYTIMESGEEAITATPELEGTIIGFRAGEDNSYTLRFEYNESDDPLYILDTENRIYTRVLTDQTYQFTTNDKAAHSRFVLTRTDGQMTPTGIDDVQGDKVHEAKAKKFIMDDKMYILFNGRVFDATGKAVK